MPTRAPRAIVDAIHSGQLLDAPTVEDPIFGLHVPLECPSVTAEILQPRNTWSDKEAYDHAARRLASLFRGNFMKYAGLAHDEIRQAGPREVEPVAV